MATGLRVRLKPLLAEGAGEGRLADGARVSFQALGKPPSQAKPDAKLPAKLRFTLELMASVRNEGPREKSVLAELEGEVELRGVERKPLFTITSGLPEPLEDLSPEPLEDQTQQERVLRLEFDAQQFAPLPSEAGNEFIVKVDVKKFRYIEIGAELELGGTAEAGAAQNEVLDVLVTPNSPPRIEDAVFVIQRDGQPLVGALVELESARGRNISRTTDAQGIVRARGRTGDPFTLISVTEQKQELSVVNFQLDDAETTAIA